MLETNLCDLCNSSYFVDEMAVRDCVSQEMFRLVRCQNCGLVFVNPRPQAETMARYYPTDFYGRGAFSSYLGTWLRKRRLDRYLGNVRPGRVLDIGCGDGRELLYLKDKGWQVLGTELSESNCARAKSMGLEVYCDDLEALGLPSESFDVVMWHVIEHLPSPKRILQEVQRILKPDGMLLLGCPNYHSIDVWLAKEKAFLEIPRHLYQFSESTLLRLFSEIGFASQTIHRFSFEIGVLATMQSILNILPFTNLYPNFVLDWLGSGLYRQRLNPTQYRQRLVGNLTAMILIGVVSLLVNMLSLVTARSNSIELCAKVVKAR